MPAPVVTTRFGPVRGRDEDGLCVFRGIRFARAPIGPLRFSPPVDPEVSIATFEAIEHGPIASQPGSGPGSYVPGDPIVQSEDCLTLNIWTPSCDEGRRPVMVFVHGGAFLTGSGSSVMYRGELLARRDVVVVTFNYRLGVLGFLAHPLLYDRSSEGFGNWGLHDQIAALRWVRDHAASFGGDPQRVTVFGESAGAMSIADLLGVPAARGLFRRAILESGACTALPAAPAARAAERIAALLGLAEPSREALVQVPVGELIAAQQSVTSAVDDGFGMPFRPVVDGGLLPRFPEDEIADGSSAEVDLLAGTNRDEFKFFAFAGGRTRSTSDEADVAALIDAYLVGGGVDDGALSGKEVVAAYREARAARGDSIEPYELLCAIAGDWIFRVPTLRLLSARASHRARHRARSFAYLFDWESPFAGGMLGACHGLELPFVFGSVRNPVVGAFAGGGDAAVELSDAMQAAWVAFAATGDPSGAAVGTWPPYELDRRQTMVLGPSIHLVDAPYEAERQFFEDHLGRYGQGGPIEGATTNTVAILAEPEA